MGGLGSGWENARRCSRYGGEAASGISPGPCSLRDRRMDQPSPDIAQGDKSLFSITPRRTMTRAWFRWLTSRGASECSPPAGKARRDWPGPRMEREVWFSATQAGLERRIYAVDLTGRQRLAYQALGGVTLQDIAPDGRVLLTRDENRAGMIGACARGKQRAGSFLAGLVAPRRSVARRKMLLFDEQGEQGGPTYTVAMRSMHVVRRRFHWAKGWRATFHPMANGQPRWCRTPRSCCCQRVREQSRRIDKGRDRAVRASNSLAARQPADRLFGNLPGHGSRCFIQNIDGGKPRPVTPEGIRICAGLSRRAISYR